MNCTPFLFGSYLKLFVESVPPNIEILNFYLYFCCDKVYSPIGHYIGGVIYEPSYP